MEQTRSIGKTNLLEGVIWKQQLRFFFPILFGIFFQQLYNTADALIVGQFVGKEALACVIGSPNVLTTLIIGFFNGLSMGAMVEVSHYFGARDFDRLNRSVYTVFVLSAVGAVIISALFCFFMPTILTIMHTPADLMDGSLLYLYIYFGCIIFSFLYNSGSAILRAIGDSRRPMLYLIVCCLLNIGLDILFVAVLHWGIAGAAFATILSQAISALLVIRIVFFHIEELHLKIRNIRADMRILRNMLRLGLPAGFQSVMYDVANMTIMTAINGLGVDTVAAYGAIGKIDALFWMVNNAFGTTVATFVGIHYGAGKIERLKKGVKQCLILSLIAAAFVSCILLFGCWHFIYAFVSDETVANIGQNMVFHLVPFYFVFEFVEIRVSALRAEGDVIVPACIVFLTTCVLRIIWISVLMAGGDYNCIQVIMCYPVSWILSAIVFSIYFGPRQNKILKALEGTK